MSGVGIGEFGTCLITGVTSAFKQPGTTVRMAAGYWIFFEPLTVMGGFRSAYRMLLTNIALSALDCTSGLFSRVGSAYTAYRKG
jgi:hypothetical protein